MVTFSHKSCPEFAMVRDNPIVNDGYLPGAILMRMRIVFRGDAMSCPPGVPDTGRAIQKGCVFAEYGNSDRFFSYLKPNLVLNGNSTRIITPVFQPFQAIKKYCTCLLFPHVTNYTAHGRLPFVFSKLKIPKLKRAFNNTKYLLPTEIYFAGNLYQHVYTRKTNRRLSPE
jgi:hypothetical protein